MAVEVCADISNSVVSPRISFSHYLNQQDEGCNSHACQHHRLPSPPPSADDDFEFPLGKPDPCFQQVYAADEVFSDGRILPSRQKEGIRSGGLPPNPGAVVGREKRGKGSEWDEGRERAASSSSTCSSSSSSSKHFWRIGRSASVNSYENRGGRRGLLQFLSRSNSTGSLAKQGDQKRGALRKHTTPVHSHPSSSSSSYCCNSTGWTVSSLLQQRRPSRKSCGQRGGEGVRVMPVLNITPFCISRPTAGFFGPLLCGGGSKDTKRK